MDLIDDSPGICKLQLDECVGQYSLGAWSNYPVSALSSGVD